MAAWLVPALKAVLPHLGTIVQVAVPVFTKKSTEAANQAQLLQQQIDELQGAATQNAQNVKALAAELQTTLGALQQAATIADTRMRRILALALAAAGFSVAALCLAAWMILIR